MTDQIRTLRVNLSKIDINWNNSSNDSIDLLAQHAKVNLLLGRNWLGEAMKYLGEAYPYEKDENRKTIADVKPAVDISDEKMTFDVTKVEDISAIREMLEKEAVLQFNESSGRKAVDRAIDIAKMHFSDVRMLLGNILGVMRDVDQAKKSIETIKEEFKGKALTKAAQQDIEYYEKKLEILGEKVIEFE